MDFRLRQDVSERIAACCVKYGARRLAVFGSVARGDDRPGSDLDVLVEFDAGQTPSLLDLGGMLMELREIFGREVDLKTPALLSPLFRDRVVRESRTLYARSGAA